MLFSIFSLDFLALEKSSTYLKGYENPQNNADSISYT